jgi:hypothetical protein
MKREKRPTTSYKRPIIKLVLAYLRSTTSVLSNFRPVTNAWSIAPPSFLDLFDLLFKKEKGLRPGRLVGMASLSDVGPYTSTSGDITVQRAR